MKEVLHDDPDKAGVPNAGEGKQRLPGWASCPRWCRRQCVMEPEAGGVAHRLACVYRECPVSGSASRYSAKWALHGGQDNCINEAHDAAADQYGRRKERETEIERF